MAERRQNAGPIGSQRKTYDQRVSDPLIGGRSPEYFSLREGWLWGLAGPGGPGPRGALTSRVEKRPKTGGGLGPIGRGLTLEKLWVPKG